MNAIQESPAEEGSSFRQEVRLAIRRPLLRECLGLLLFGVAFYFAYRYAMAFDQALASPFWFPDSVLLCALLATRPRRWPFYILAALPIRLFSEVAQDIPLWFLLVTFVIDSAKALLAALALRHFSANPMRLDSVRQFGVFFAFAVLLVPAASAFAGAAARQALGADFWNSWDQWFMGNALTQLVVTPAILYWFFGAGTRRPPRETQWIEAGALLVGLVLTAYLAANTNEGSVTLLQTRLYAPIPFLFWAAIRFGMLGASGGVLILAVLMVHAALQGGGPFADLSPTATAHALQNFLLLRAAPLYLVAVVVEQRWSVERSLRESEQRFRTMANAAPVMMWVTARDKSCEFVNAGWLQFTGLSLQDHIGYGWADSLHPEDRQRVLSIYYSAFDEHSRFEMEYRMHRHDGEYRWIFDIGVPRYAENGEFLGYVGSAIDITDRKRTEEATRTLAHTQRLAVMGELTALIAHEVRQPLTAILLNADAARNLLQREQPPLDELTEIMSNIRKYDLRAEDTIGRIRAFVRNHEITRRPLDINATIADVLRLISSDAGRRGVQIRSEFTPDLPAVLGDPTQLQQVMMNLIVNAMDAQAATPEDTRHVVVTTTLYDHTNVEVAVRDYGCGIAPDKLSQLFDSFFTTSPNGMGLGLSIARSIVTAHHGKIFAENNSDGGATFRFTLPTN